MNLNLKKLSTLPLQDNLLTNIQQIFNEFQKADTYTHSLEVAKQTVTLCERFSIDVKKGEVAGLLHDISAIFPVDERIEICHYFNIELCTEDYIFPLITHQKISKVIAENYLKIEDKDIFSAISCHTTLKGKPSQLDLALFVADKIAWDQPGIPPYIDELTSALDQSLEAAALCYINYLLASKIKVIHPLLKDAHQYLITENY